MSDIVWSNAHNLGIQHIDEEHKIFFSLAYRIDNLENSDNLKYEIKEILYEFHNYIKTHFYDEEEFMESIDYPNLEEHKILHTKIIDSVSKIIQTPAILSVIKSKLKIVVKKTFMDENSKKMNTDLVQQDSSISNEAIFYLS